MIKWILASKSPRRKELLEQMGVDFEIQPSYGDEVITATDPEQVVVELATQKAQEVALMYMNRMDTYQEQEDGYLIIGADTIVVVDGRIMGKPKDEAEAESMLERISGGVHQVYTGVCEILITERGMDSHSFFERTDVTVCPLRIGEIKNYVRSNEPYDKAGGYAIQGKFGLYIKKIDGDYNNVVGLPISRLYQETVRKYPLVFYAPKCSCGKEDCTCGGRGQGLINVSNEDFDR